MKTGLANILQFLSTSLVLAWLLMSLLFVCLFVFFFGGGGGGYAFVSEVAVERISQICVLSNPPSSLDGVFPTLPRILCLTQVTVIIEISAHSKLVSVPFSTLHFVIGHLEKRFPESIMQSSEKGQRKCDSQKVCIVQYRIVFSFHLGKRINHLIIFRLC